MYRKLLAGVLGLNGLVLLGIGVGIAASARSQLGELALEPSQIARIIPTFYGLGLADASSSLFSLLALWLVIRRRPAGRILAFVVAANQLVVGVGLYLLAGFVPALPLIAGRGVIIGALAWRLPAREGAPPR
jgi:CHASE2 domain-containing sensor protein